MCENSNIAIKYKVKTTENSKIDLWNMRREPKDGRIREGGKGKEINKKEVVGFEKCLYVHQVPIRHVIITYYKHNIYGIYMGRGPKGAGTGREGKGLKKGIGKYHHIRVPIPHDECNHNVLQTFINKTKDKRNLASRFILSLK